MNLSAIDAGTLEGIFPFADDGERAELLPCLTERRCLADEVLMRPGELAEGMAFVLSGRIAVKRETEFPGRFVLLALLEKGSVLCELSILDSTPRKALLVAAEETRLLLLSRRDFDRLARDHPALAMKIYRQVILALGQRLRGAGERLGRLL